MTRENKPEGVTEKRNEYAYWAVPGVSATVTYSLPVFHEIDFAVNEGFRKIPHGGIEEGGLLFGTIDEKGTRVETFRLIACEHSAGPSFLLSDRDLQMLHDQIETSATDPELEGLHVVGWFLAHTRGPLTLTDREADLCDQLFNHAGMLTVLVKPERFQPTRFGFLVRGQDGSLNRDSLQNDFILPLPGRNPKPSNAPVASIPAPTTTTAGRRPVEATVEKLPDAAPPLPEAPPAIPQEHEAASASTPVAAPVNRAARRQQRLNVEQVEPKHAEEEPAYPIRSREAESHDVVPASVPSASRSSELESIRRNDLSPERGGSGRAMTLRPLPHEDHLLDDSEFQRHMELLNQKKPAGATARMVLILPLAALLGCLVGWLAFLQVPPPIISLSVKSRGENIVVSWPPEQTRNAIYAAVRVDDSTPVPLTPEEKLAGRVEVQARPDMKIELIARNWIRDSRGIVHYVKAVANTGP
jgi:hypothetical protein